jgi:NTP pyrophosphatase (non-canonical NTP hydrolase)
MNALTPRIIDDLNFLINRAHTKHGALDNSMAVLGALTEEYYEVIEAIRRNESWRVRQELMDTANVALRGVLAIDAAEAQRRANGGGQ